MDVQVLSHERECLSVYLTTGREPGEQPSNLMARFILLPRATLVLLFLRSSTARVSWKRLTLPQAMAAVSQAESGGCSRRDVVWLVRTRQPASVEHDLVGVYGGFPDQKAEFEGEGEESREYRIVGLFCLLSRVLPSIVRRSVRPWLSVPVAVASHDASNAISGIFRRLSTASSED